MQWPDVWDSSSARLDFGTRAIMLQVSLGWQLSSSLALATGGLGIVFAPIFWIGMIIHAIVAKPFA